MVVARWLNPLPGWSGMISSRFGLAQLKPGTIFSWSHASQARRSSALPPGSTPLAHRNSAIGCPHQDAPVFEPRRRIWSRSSGSPGRSRRCRVLVGLCEHHTKVWREGRQVGFDEPVKALADGTIVIFDGGCLIEKSLFRLRYLLCGAPLIAARSSTVNRLAAFLFPRLWRISSVCSSLPPRRVLPI